MKPENKDIRPEKKSIAAELDERVSGALYMILADYTGMDQPKKSIRQSTIILINFQMATFWN